MHPRGDALVAEIAARQHGVVTTAQLAAAGLGRRAVAHRVKHRRLTPLHRGVYLVGPNHTSLTSPMAAVLACGPTAVLSHHAAAALHGIAPERTGAIDVTVPSGRPESRPGVRVHRTRHLASADVTEERGIRVTTVARTLVDLAGELPARELRRAVEEAQIQRKLDHLSLGEAVDQARGRRGVAALRAAVQTAEPKLTRSEAERRLLRLVEAAYLPRPATNVRLGRYEVDALWHGERLVVEVDGFAFHSTRAAFERDRRRDAELQAAGYRVMRVTWRQLADEPEAVVARLAAALVSRSSRAPA